MAQKNVSPRERSGLSILLDFSQVPYTYLVQISTLLMGDSIFSRTDQLCVTGESPSFSKPTCEMEDSVTVCICAILKIKQISTFSKRLSFHMFSLSIITVSYRASQARTIPIAQTWGIQAWRCQVMFPNKENKVTDLFRACNLGTT